MLSPLTIVLIKTLGRGFYRAHSGLLLSLFVTFVIYCLFINVLNETHIPADQRIYYNLIFVLAFVSSPLVSLLVFALWLVYTIKCWSHILEALSAPEHLFLFYSSTSLRKFSQLRSWGMLQLYISLPIVGYGLFSVVIGLVFHHNILPLFILIYLCLLTLLSAIIYGWAVNRRMDQHGQSWLLRLMRAWRKPFFSLFLYHIIDQLKLSCIITKVVSLIIILGGRYLFAEQHQDMRLAGFLVLGVSVAHSVLIYEYHRFEHLYMRFARNLPYGRLRLFFYSIGLYSLLLLPEIIWLLATHHLATAMVLGGFMLSFTLLFHSLLYAMALHIRKYLRVVFSLFILTFLMIMYHLLWLLTPVCFLAAVVLFYRNYYQPADTAPD
ncbi:MAG: hypothetical protein RIG62_26560 [Cyclobacteriaceae bacterium]